MRNTSFENVENVVKPPQKPTTANARIAAAFPVPRASQPERSPIARYNAEPVTSFKVEKDLVL